MKKTSAILAGHRLHGKTAEELPAYPSPTLGERASQSLRGAAEGFAGVTQRMSERAARNPAIGTEAFRQMPLNRRVELSGIPAVADRVDQRIQQGERPLGPLGVGPMRRLEEYTDKLQASGVADRAEEAAAAHHLGRAYPSTAASIYQRAFEGAMPEGFARDTSRIARYAPIPDPRVYREVIGLPEQDIPIAGGGPLRGELTPRNIGTAVDAVSGAVTSSPTRLLSALLRQMQSYAPEYKEGPISRFDRQGNPRPPAKGPGPLE